MDFPCQSKFRLAIRRPKFSQALHLPEASISCEKMIFCFKAINFIEFHIHLYIHATFPHICMKKSQTHNFIPGFFLRWVGFFLCHNVWKFCLIFLFTLIFASTFLQKPKRWEEQQKCLTCATIIILHIWKQWPFWWTLY